MRGSGVDHLDLVVSSLERSLPLYRELVAPLGYARATEIVGERGERVVYDSDGIKLEVVHVPNAP
jgi:hypothetical protein